MFLARKFAVYYITYITDPVPSCPAPGSPAGHIHRMRMPWFTSGFT